MMYVGLMGAAQNLVPGQRTKIQPKLFRKLQLDRKLLDYKGGHRKRNAPLTTPLSIPKGNAPNSIARNSQSSLNTEVNEWSLTRELGSPGANGGQQY